MKPGPVTLGEGVHPTAIVSPEAQLATGVQVGPGAVIGPGVHIAAGVVIGAYAVIDKDTHIGENSRIFHGAVVGADPQDLKYAGEPTRLEVGERTTIREFCSLHRGTVATGLTRVGSDCLLMTGCHVAHDCRVGDNVVLANGAAIGGHVEIGDWAILGGLAGVHQFCRIGEHAFVGGAAKITKDIPPFVLADGNPCRLRTINVIGLQRRGFSREAIDGLRDAFRILFRNRRMNLGQALAHLEANENLDTSVASLVAYIRGSERGIHT
jgi:UDP-N-acetylglucosamine acyltransferase